MELALYTRHCPTVAYLTSSSKGRSGDTCPFWAYVVDQRTFGECRLEAELLLEVLYALRYKGEVGEENEEVARYVSGLF